MSSSPLRSITDVKIEVAYNGGGILEDDQYERVKRNIY